MARAGQFAARWSPRIRAWAAETLGLWAGAGCDPAGGFWERLGPDGMPDRSLDYRRVMPQFRQIFAHAIAAPMGLDYDGGPMVRHGLAFVDNRCWDRAAGGYAYRLSGDGRAVLDGMKDAYCQAFALFGLAHGYRATGDAALLDRAAEVQALLDRHLLLAEGGYHAVAEADWTRRPDLLRQNPNMHLLEGFIALHQMAPGHFPLDHANRQVALFRDRLFDPATGTLGEYFGPGWRPDPADGHRVEPGHHFEWVWLLHLHARLSGDRRALPMARALFDHACRFGIDAEHGGIYDEVARDGTPLVTTKRIWPLTEYLKALAARIEDEPEGQNAGQAADLWSRLDQALGWLFGAYLQPGGRWREHLTRDLAGQTNIMMPASTGYHILLALAELVRVVEGKASVGDAA